MPMCLQWITSPQRKERKQTMNFIQVKNFLSNYIHTVLLLRVGCYHLTNKCLLWLVSAGHSAYWGSGHAKYRTEGG